MGCLICMFAPTFVTKDNRDYIFLLFQTTFLKSAAGYHAIQQNIRLGWQYLDLDSQSSPTKDTNHVKLKIDRHQFF